MMSCSSSLARRPTLQNTSGPLTKLQRRSECVRFLCAGLNKHYTSFPTSASQGRCRHSLPPDLRSSTPSRFTVCNWQRKMASSAAGRAQRPPPAEPRPSASVILVSPSNEILLLHRVQTSRSFPSAHVFPGGNISPEQDGEVAPPGSAERHEDGLAYRLGAIRECFEESGIVLAKGQGSSGGESASLLEVPEEARMQARKDVHTNQMTFPQWLEQKGAIADTDGLVPFTRWITPANLPRRFTTQMYLYFLPLQTSASRAPFPSSAHMTGAEAPASENTTLVPTPDDGVEHTAASFRPAATWLSLAQSGEIILFPPQFYLLHLLAPLLPPSSQSDHGPPSSLEEQRDAVLSLIRSGDPPWGERCISPSSLGYVNQKAVLGLDRPGREVEEQQKVETKGNSGQGAEQPRSKKRGVIEHVVLVRFDKAANTPRAAEVRDRSAMMHLMRRQQKEGVSDAVEGSGFQEKDRRGDKEKL